MASSTWLKERLNQLLHPVNLRLETLTAARRDAERLKGLAARGHFSEPVFPIPAAVRRCDPAAIYESVDRYAQRMAELAVPGAASSGYSFDNDYFRSPDAEVYYALIREHRPGRIIEVGCGNSTRLARQAVADGKLATRIVCIDPNPRLEVTSIADEVIRQPVEAIPVDQLTGRLQAGDVLFIDSSHEVRTGSDVTYLYLQLLPSLKAGVLVHIHDIFLPYEYPEPWVREQGLSWNEQYLVQALLTGEHFDVLWPGHYLQRTSPGFSAHLPRNVHGWPAQSLWLKVRGSGR